MTFPTDWDVEKYRVEHECEEHWELRRKFLETHKDKYPEDRLVCLAQVFYNVEFMGCRYPEKTMRLVAQLSRDVADDHREKMKTKLQRTFVQASDAASTKVKGRSRNEDAAQNKAKPIQFQQATEHLSSVDKNSTASSNRNEMRSQNLLHNQELPQHQSTDPFPQNNAISSVPGRYVLADQARFEGCKSNRKRPHQEQEHAVPKKLRKIEDLSSRLVLLQHGEVGPYGMLSSSTAASHMKLQLDIKQESKGVEAALSIDGLLVSKAFDSTVDKAKKKCAAESLAKLQKFCYTLIVKDRLAGSAVDKSQVAGAPSEDNSQSDVPEHIAEDSKVNRMMKLMGWGGGGLGKNEQGREKPVEVVERVKRAGLGLAQTGKSDKEFRKSMTDLLLKYRSSDNQHDLVFASDFSKEERALIHTISRKLGLKSISHGKEPDRQLVVMRKKTPLMILEEVRNAGGSTVKYDLVPPAAIKIPGTSSSNNQTAVKKIN